MKRGRSTGNKTKAQEARLDAIKDIGCILCRCTRLLLDDVRAEFRGMVGQNRRAS